MSDTDTTETTAPETSGGLAEQSAAVTPIAVTGATTYRGRRIRELQREISELSLAVHEVLTTGTSYSLSNSHSVTRANVAEIQSQLAAKKSELAALLRRGQFSPMRLEPTKFF